MKKIKTLHKFTDANIDGEKLEKANENIKNAINEKTKKKENKWKPSEELSHFYLRDDKLYNRKSKTP